MFSLPSQIQRKHLIVNPSDPSCHHQEKLGGSGPKVGGLGGRCWLCLVPQCLLKEPHQVPGSGEAAPSTGVREASTPGGGGLR